MPKGSKHVPFDCWMALRKSAAVSSSHLGDSFPCALAPPAPAKRVAPNRVSVTVPPRFIFRPSPSPRILLPRNEKRIIGLAAKTVHVFKPFPCADNVLSGMPDILLLEMLVGRRRCREDLGRASHRILGAWPAVRL